MYLYHIVHWMQCTVICGQCPLGNWASFYPCTVLSFLMSLLPLITRASSIIVEGGGNPDLQSEKNAAVEKVSRCRPGLKSVGQVWGGGALCGPTLPCSALCATVCPRPVTGSVQHTLFYQRGSVAVWQCGCVEAWTKLCGLREKSHGWRYQATGLDRTLAASNKITREGKGVKTVDYCTLAYCHHLESLLSAG